MVNMKDQAPTTHRQLLPLKNHLWFNPATCTVRRKGKSIPLTAQEARLLTALLSAPNRLHSADTLACLLTHRAQ